MSDRTAVEAVLDTFHTAAAAADEERYAATLSSSMVFLGTAPGERWQAGEEAIVRDMRQSFFNRDVRRLVKHAVADQLSDADDYAQRTKKLSEQALFLTHRQLAQIPFVGQVEYREA